MLEQLLEEYNLAIKFVALAIAVFLIWLEVRRHRTFRERELKLQTERLEFDRAKWTLEAEHIKAQTSRLDRFVIPIADRLKDQLKDDSEWIADALRRSELFPYESTVFGRRSDHFNEEKVYIAKQFTTMLVSHFERLAEDNQTICLMIDSGTTLYPFFEFIGNAVLTADRSASWIGKVEIITNNIPGVFSLMRVARRHSISGTPTLPIKCTVVAGQLLTSYVALTGEDTERSIRQLVEEREGAHFISLVTGNWIRLSRKTRCAIPLARGKGQLEFKQLIMHLSDQTYVVAPLGKILDINKNEVNPLLQTSYREVDTADEQHGISVDKVRLVTTYRTRPTSILYKHGLFVKDYLDPRNGSFAEDLGANHHIIIAFDLENDDKDAQKMIEFPHVHTHRADFYKKFRVE